MIGDWTLLCTAVTSRRGMDGSNDNRSSKNKKKNGGLPFKLPENPLAKEQQRIREKVRRSVEVTQRIRTSSSQDEEEGCNDIARVDNVVEFSPPFQTLSDILGGDNGDAGGLFKDVKINPLEVKKTKVALIHDASVESVSPVLRTKISLKSVVREFSS
uniref:Uncharacterized protein n=1 Tax=Pseudictyota dubia TaxID=2749911 RepID=A0A7R9WLB2_9STRA|mmetsp:Transcript_842/g.1312  ORF Transcript_842/g.1312 Transcript_842/m.1312 type:complete len:158 (+) Transcript_842:654-1127(+)